MRDVLFEDEGEVARVPLHLDSGRRPVLADEREGRDPEAQDERQAEDDDGLTEEPGAVGERRADLCAARRPRARAGGLPAALGDARSVNDGLCRAARRQARRPPRRDKVSGDGTVHPGRAGKSFGCRMGEKPTHLVRRDANRTPQRLAPDQDHRQTRSRIRPSGVSSPADRPKRAPDPDLMSAAEFPPFGREPLESFISGSRTP